MFADYGANSLGQNLPDEEIGVVNDETILLDGEDWCLSGELNGRGCTVRREAMVELSLIHI